MGAGSRLLHNVGILIQHPELINMLFTQNIFPLSLDFIFLLLGQIKETFHEFRKKHSPGRESSHPSKWLTSLWMTCGRHPTLERAEGFKVRRTGWSDASVTCWLWNPGTAQISLSLFLTSTQPQGCSNVIGAQPVTRGWCVSSLVSGPQLSITIFKKLRINIFFS